MAVLRPDEVTTGAKHGMRTTTQSERGAIGALYAGLGLTVAATIVPPQHLVGQHRRRRTPGPAQVTVGALAYREDLAAHWPQAPAARRVAMTTGSFGMSAQAISK
jgi:hypothetical protein